MKTGSFLMLYSLALFQLFPGSSLGAPLTDADFVKVEGGCFQMGDQFGDGLPDEVLTEKNIRNLYDAPINVEIDPETGRPRVYPRSES